MSHIPVNHPLRGVYRGINAVIGLALLVFGVLGVIRAWGDPFFGRGNVEVFGIDTNLALAVLSILAGGLVLAAAILGGNVNHFVGLWVGGLMVVVSLFQLAVQRTDANKLNFTVGAAVTGMLLGMMLVCAGLYTKTGSKEMSVAEEQFRHKSAAT